MSENFLGSCACNAINYVVRKNVQFVVNCHCNNCKKLTGAPFSSIAVALDQDFEIIKGKNEVSTFNISDNVKKHFCSSCGTPIYNLNKKYPGKCMIYLGSLDDPRCVTPSINIYCESMLPWLYSINEMRNFDQEITE